MAKTTAGKECGIVDYMECFIHVWALFRWKIFVEMSCHSLILFEPFTECNTSLTIAVENLGHGEFVNVRVEMFTYGYS